MLPLTYYYLVYSFHGFPVDFQKCFSTCLSIKLLTLVLSKKKKACDKGHDKLKRPFYSKRDGISGLGWGKYKLYIKQFYLSNNFNYQDSTLFFFSYSFI